VIAGEGRKNDFLEHGDFGVHEAGLALFFAAHAEGFNFVGGDTGFKVENNLFNVSRFVVLGSSLVVWGRFDHGGFCRVRNYQIKY